MKIRSGFVSNSSSSSFIIAFDKPTICPTCGQEINSLIKAIRCSDYHDTEIHYYTASEVLKSFAKQSDNGIKDFEEKFNRIAELSAEGKDIIEVEISNWDEEVRELLNSGGVEVIFNSDTDYEGGW